MEIIAHRGLWREEKQRNSREALMGALKEGFGIETDIRDQGEDLVISHDIPVGAQITLDEVFYYYCKCNSSATIALNIKADGLQGLLKKRLQEYRIEKYFVFDMSIPETMKYKDDFSIFGRISEFEKEFPFRDAVKGVWIDSFIGEWYSDEEIMRYAEEMNVCIVSPELHGRAYKKMWERCLNIMQMHPELGAKLAICTDRPMEASRFFGGN